MPLSREDVALIVLSLAGTKEFTPAQIQKALFLASDKVPGVFAPGSSYDFQPYDYGPFDAGVYSDVEQLEREGFAQITQPPLTRWKNYSATQSGVERGFQLSKAVPIHDLDILEKIVVLVRSMTFNELISAVYRAYPHMRERSVFRD